MPIYMIIVLDIVIIIHFSINCPTVICLPTVCYFSREATSEIYGPWVCLSSYTFISILLLAFPIYLLLLFQIYIIKNPKIFRWVLFPFILLASINLSIYHITLPKRDWQPLYASGCEYLLFVCRCRLHNLLGSPTGLITLVSQLREIPTVVVLHHPFLFGDAVSSNIMPQPTFGCFNKKESLD